MAHHPLGTLQIQCIRFFHCAIGKLRNNYRPILFKWCTIWLSSGSTCHARCLKSLTCGQSLHLYYLGEMSSIACCSVWHSCFNTKPCEFYLARFLPWWWCEGQRAAGATEKDIQSCRIASEFLDGDDTQTQKNIGRSIKCDAGCHLRMFESLGKTHILKNANKLLLK